MSYTIFRNNLHLKVSISLKIQKISNISYFEINSFNNNYILVEICIFTKDQNLHIKIISIYYNIFSKINLNVIASDYIRR